MKKIIIIVGARPNFIKAYPVYQSLKNNYELTLIHTGQHFDEKMSKIFFEDMGFSKPDIQFNLSSKTKAGDFDDKLYINNSSLLENKNIVIDQLLNYDGSKLGQLGEIRDKLIYQFELLNPNLVMVFGDVTSTLAGALAAKKLNIKIAHIESGLRSFDLNMPEEINRILTDHLTDYYFITEESGLHNLKKENLNNNLYLVGNTMIDCLFMFKNIALLTQSHKKLNKKKDNYILVTLHRPSNVDNLDNLKKIIQDIITLSKQENIIFPIHPRTKEKLKKLQLFDKMENIKTCEPVGYLEFLCLQMNAKYIITDSGGIQEETTVLNIPCFTLRHNTERPSTLIENGGTNTLIKQITYSMYNINKYSKLNTIKENFDREAAKKIKFIINNLIT